MKARATRVGAVMLFRDAVGWSVLPAVGRGALRRYRYGSEAQARSFAAVLALGPRVLPTGGKRGTGRRSAPPMR